ncbi:hypothetical protein KK141_22850 [Dyella sp. LX-66]|uniref:hypothetical protein n=1 Tax=Dyella sp. LX-66 TaxID=2838832 RepID=UPI001BE00521|nr:hypothetical protein [Dyella sp. LX-66]MBT2142398.1 hypothetical protein [Dyella sp. LX-66]
MDDASKIGLSIVAAAALLLVGFVSYREHEKRQAAEAIEDAIQQFAKEFPPPPPIAYPPRADESARQHQAAAFLAAEQRRQALQLAPDERCIGGTVVRVSGNSYTQVAGAAGRPAACAGRQRLDLSR